MSCPRHFAIKYVLLIYASSAGCIANMALTFTISVLTRFTTAVGRRPPAARSSTVNSTQLSRPHRKSAHCLRHITFRVRRSRGEMYIGHGRLRVCLSVSLSLAAFSHYCTDPDVAWGIVASAL